MINVCDIQVMKPLLAAGFLSLIPGMGFASKVDSFILQGYEFLCTFFDKLPFHTWNPGRPHVWQVVLYYGILTGIVLCEERRRELEKRKEAEKRRARRNGVR